jgi:hypothetical protein
LSEEQQRCSAWLEIVAHLLTKGREIVAPAAFSQLADVAANGRSCRDSKHRHKENSPSYSADDRAGDGPGPDGVSFALMFDLPVCAFRHQRRIKNLEVTRIMEPARSGRGLFGSFDIGINKSDYRGHGSTPFFCFRAGRQQLSCRPG